MTKPIGHKFIDNCWIIVYHCILHCKQLFNRKLISSSAAICSDWIELTVGRNVRHKRGRGRGRERERGLYKLFIIIISTWLDRGKYDECGDMIPALESAKASVKHNRISIKRGKKKAKSKEPFVCFSCCIASSSAFVLAWTQEWWKCETAKRRQQKVEPVTDVR